MATYSSETQAEPVKVLGHVVSAALWMSTLDTAVRRGGAYWIPVAVGLAGHVLSEVLLTSEGPVK